MDDINLMNAVPVALAAVIAISAFLMMFTTVFTNRR